MPCAICSCASAVACRAGFGTSGRICSGDKPPNILPGPEAAGDGMQELAAMPRLAERCNAAMAMAALSAVAAAAAAADGVPAFSRLQTEHKLYT